MGLYAKMVEACPRKNDDPKDWALITACEVLLTPSWQLAEFVGNNKQLAASSKDFHTWNEQQIAKTFIAFMTQRLYVPLEILSFYNAAEQGYRPVNESVNAIYKVFLAGFASSDNPFFSVFKKDEEE